MAELWLNDMLGDTGSSDIQTGTNLLLHHGCLIALHKALQVV